MKDQACGKGLREHSKEPSYFHQPFPSHLSRLSGIKTLHQGTHPPLKPSPKVFLPLSLEETKQLEILFQSLLEVESLLETEISPGHSAGTCSLLAVQLQIPSLESSIHKRRRLA